MTKAEEKGLEVYPIESHEMYDDMYKERNAYVKGYKAGYTEGFEDGIRDTVEEKGLVDIDDVCDYIKDNLYKFLYVYNEEAGFPTAQFIKDLRKAMTEE